MMRKQDSEEANLTTNFTKGSQEAYEKLYLKYRHAIRGYISYRCLPWVHQKARSTLKEKEVDQRIKEVEQETWSQIWEKRADYDKDRASFYCFVRYWAEIMVKRQFYKKSRDIPFSSFENEENEIPAADTIDKISIKDIIPLQDEYLDKCRQFLKITFSEGGPPHQLIVFGFSKLLRGWGPQAVVKELSPEVLKNLTDRLCVNYQEESSLPGYIIKDCFKPLQDKMPKKVEEVLQDEASRKAYVKLLRIIVGESILKAYYGSDPEHNISDWSNKVAKKAARLSQILISKPALETVKSGNGREE